MEDMTLPYSCHMERDIKKIDSLPLAMAYVPWQTWGNLYKPEEGLKQGTIFKDLNLPFTGRRCGK
ncbi:MAG: spore coat associated protein CotJA [Lachnospiraceae bacterium]|nr:spore coat associated protein CotJA [Lachnospiraceae bacterium]